LLILYISFVDHSDDELEADERKRLEDLRERDEFAERLKTKDKEQTKKLVGEKITEKAAAEALKKKILANDKETREVVLPDLRDKSRYEYLKKREEQKVAVLQQTIAGQFPFGFLTRARTHTLIIL